MTEEKNHQAKHDHDVRYVEYPRVKRSDADEHEVCDESLSCNAVNQVARSTRPNQRKTNEGPAAELSVDQICEQSEQARPGADGE